jgi:hypothetical protein
MIDASKPFFITSRWAGKNVSNEVANISFHLLINEK